MCILHSDRRDILRTCFVKSERIRETRPAVKSCDMFLKLKKDESYSKDQCGVNTEAQVFS